MSWWFDAWALRKIKMKIHIFDISTVVLENLQPRDMLRERRGREELREGRGDGLDDAAALRPEGREGRGLVRVGRGLCWL